MDRAPGRAIRLVVALLCVCHAARGYGGEEHGPRFVVEPPVSVFFSNATGARVECAAEGTPRPLVRWQTVRDGSTVRDAAGLMHVDDNGTLVFAPFAEHQYAADVHSAAYRCVAHSRAGTVLSRTVQVRAEVIRNFEPIVRDTVTMPGNVAVFNCHIPGVSYNENNALPESVAITSWVQDGVFNIFPSWEIDSKIIMIPKTGQLRIANVDENDLRHSYTCRIVNKLTGFTQESSTFGRIYFESNRTMAPWSKSNDFTVHLVKQGDHLLLPCDVYGFPPPKVTWSSETSTVVVSADTTAGGGGRSKAPMNFLRLRSVQRTDAGNYTCTAKNTAGHKSLQHRVIVAPDMSAHVVPALAEIESGRSVSFTCITSTADDSQIVTWLKDGVPRKSSSSTPPTYTLNVDSVQKDDQGMYQCVVTNTLNSEMAHSFAELRLSASKPTLKYKFIGHLLKPGPDVSLKCIAVGTPTPHITWKFDGNDVPLSQMRVSVSQFVTEIGDVVSHFNITKVQVEDGGVYECIVSNRAGQVSHSAKLQVYGNPVAKATPKIIARAGQPLQMTCPISGYPIFNINWEKDNKRLPGGKSLNKRHKVFANGSIVIENVQKKTDQGVYYCEASNEKHVVRASVDVTVIEPPHIHPFTIGDGYHECGRVGWQCFITKGDGPLSIQWLKDNQSLDPASVPSLSVTKQNEYSSSVLIESINLAHEGNYTCRASNPVATVEHTVTLTVLVPPEWIIEPKDVNVVRDEQAEVNCSASGHPKPTIKWRKGSSKDSDQFSDVTDNVTSDGTLVINKVTKKHEGFYMCEANNDVGTPVVSIVRFNVQDLPHIILPNTKYTSINGGVASMACEATGDQPIHISWIKGSVQLNYKSTNLRYNVEEVYTDASVKSKLIISKVSAADSGRYVCVAENSLGKHEAAMELEIKVLGSPPDDLSCNVTTPNSIRLRWTDLNANNLMNDYVQGYVLTYSKVVPPDDLISEYNEIEVFHNGDDATISNLDTYTEYVFSIRANTIQGPGKSSKPLICKTSESLPEAPVGLKSMLLSSNMALISWIPPIHPNGEIQRYTLYEREKVNGMQGAVKSQSYEPHVRQVQLSMFRHSSSYLWWITATNSVGESDKSRTATLSMVKSGGMPASIGNFHSSIQTKWHVDIDIPCVTSGVPSPNVKWTFNGQPADFQSHRSVYDNFTLHLDSVTGLDTGNYTCTAWNVYGSENVTTSLLVVEPPKPPILDTVNVTWTNVTVNWTKAPNTYAVQQYLLSYKYINEPENMYTELSLPSHLNVFTLSNINCGTTVAFSISASNRVGHGMQSRPFNVKTLQGKTPIAPPQNEAIEQMVSGFLIHLQKWNAKHCPITRFSVYKRVVAEKDWITVNENISPNGIYSIENLYPSTNYNILVKSYNSAGMTSTMYTVSTLTAYGGNYDKEALSVNDRIMHTIYNIAIMWPIGLAILSLIIVSVSLVVCYKYRHMYKKNQRHLEANNMILKHNNCSKSEIHSDAYETCTPFKSKSTILTNDESNYNEISPYATFQISPSKSPKRNKQFFCTNCGENMEICNCNRLYCSQTDYTNFLRRPIPKRVPSYSDNNNEDAKSHGSIHEFYDIERNSKTCESIKKPKRRLLPLPDSRRGSSQSSRECRGTNLHETTFMMPIQHHGSYSHDTDEDDNGTMSSGRGTRPAPYRVCY